MRRRGGALLYTTFALATLPPLAVLAVDTGWVYQQQAKLQDVADAAALHGARGLVDENGDPSGNWLINVRQITSAANEVDLKMPATSATLAGTITSTLQPGTSGTGGTSTTGANTDTQRGFWDTEAKVFRVVPQGTQHEVPAVQVRVSKRVPLFFGAFVSESSHDLTAVAVAKAKPGRDRQHVYYALLGKQGITADGTADFDSYNAIERRTFPGSNGAGDQNFMGGTNGSVTMHSGVEIWGSFFQSSDAPVLVSESMMRAGGEIGDIDYDISFDDVEIPSGAVDLGSVEQESGTLILAGGVYVTDDFSIARGAKLETTGPVEIYFRDTARISGRVETYDTLPANLKLVQARAGKEIRIDAPRSTRNEHVMLADVFNPGGKVHLDGKVDFYGRIWGDDVHLTAGSDFYGDTSLTLDMSEAYGAAALVR